LAVAVRRRPTGKAKDNFLDFFERHDALLLAVDAQHDLDLAREGSMGRDPMLFAGS
jgi:hypothetical protein